MYYARHDLLRFEYSVFIELKFFFYLNAFSREIDH